MDIVAGNGRAFRGLIVAPYGVVSSHRGDRQYLGTLIRQLRDRGHELWFLGLGISPEGIRAMTEIWGDRFIAPPASRFCTRLNRIRREIQFHVWHEFGVDTHYNWAWNSVVSQLQQRIGFDYVAVNTVFYSRVFEAFPSTVRKIILTHDCYAHRMKRNNDQGIPGRMNSCFPEDEKKALLRGGDIVAIQAEEARLFEEYVGRARRIVTLPHVCSWNPIADPGGFVVGFLSASNPRNQSGLDWFYQKCWARIRAKIPEATLLVAGGICTETGSWTGQAGVVSMGEVGDLADFHRRTTVEINPIFVGTGLKIKTVETLGHGRSLVSSQEGVRGISLEYGAFIATDDAESFAEAVIQLLQQPAQRASLVEGARRLIADWTADRKK